MLKNFENRDSKDEPGFIGVIGGRGRMGGLLVRLLEGRGRQVLVADETSGEAEWAAAAQAPVVFLAAPVGAMAAAARRLGPYARPDGLVTDICSLKEAPLAALLAHCRGEVIGSHPLFGPGVESLRGQTVFLCPAREGAWRPWLEAFWSDQGAQVVVIEPGEHDRLMAVVQTLRHLLVLGFGLTLKSLAFDGAAVEGVCGPWFAALWRMLVNQFHQPPELYMDLALSNPNLPQVLGSLHDSFSGLVAAYAAGDRPAIADLMGRVEEHLRRA